MVWEGKTIVYIDMDHTLCDYDTTYKRYQAENPSTPFPQSIPGFYSSMDPLPGAVEVYRWLHSQDQLAVFILTAPSLKNPHSYMEKRLWVEHHLGFEVVDRLIINPHKGLNKGQYLIDNLTSGKGQEYFEGELIHFGSEHFPTWNVVKNFFRGILLVD